VSAEEPAPISEQQIEWQRSSEVHGPNFAEPATAAGDRVPRLVAFGAVPLSAALCRAARALGWTPYVVDPRERFATAERFPGAEEVVVAWPAEAFAEIDAPDRATAVVVLTHAPELDDPALEIALRSDAFYVGALGSRRTQGARRERLTAAGLDDAALARLSGPAGLDLGGETVGEAALSILGEAVAALHGRDGARLTSSANAIHPAGRP
jgi:xanthine dehydrogenase accessory factor